MGENGFLQMLQEAMTPEWGEVLGLGKAGNDGLFRICEATKLSKNGLRVSLLQQPVVGPVKSPGIVYPSFLCG